MKNSTIYKNKYKKDHYIRKELCFKKDEWNLVYSVFIQHKISLKDVIIRYANCVYNSKEGKEEFNEKLGDIK